MCSKTLEDENAKDNEVTLILQDRSTKFLSKSSKLISKSIFADDGIVLCIYGTKTGTGAYLHMSDSQEGFSDFVNCMVERAHTDKNFEGYVKAIQFVINDIIEKMDGNQDTEN